MKGKPTFVALVLAAVLALAAVADGVEQTREGYVAAVEPICKRDREAGARILADTRENIRDGRLAVAGRELIRAAARFGVTIRQLVAIPRPPVDEERLKKWFKFLRIVRERIRLTGKLYKEGRRLQATHQSIRAERSGNAANNVSFVFGFHYCRLGRSRLG